MADFKFIAFVFIAMGFGLDSLGIANFWATSGTYKDKVESVSTVVFLSITYFFSSLH